MATPIRQYGLATLFFVTTVIAIVVAGYLRIGVGGAIASVGFAWMGLIGVYFLYSGYTDRSEGHLMSIGFGTAFCSITVLWFWFINSSLTPLLPDRPSIDLGSIINLAPKAGVGLVIGGALLYAIWRSMKPF